MVAAWTKPQDGHTFENLKHYKYNQILLCKCHCICKILNLMISYEYENPEIKKQINKVRNNKINCAHFLFIIKLIYVEE